MNVSDIFCFIPAKAASTRLIKKNLLKIGGIEIVGRAVQTAKKTALFGENIIVSTESGEVKEAAEKYGAQVPFLRDEKLARDPFGIKDVLLDFLEKTPAYKNFNYVAILLPTFPFLNEEDVTACYNQINRTDSSVVMTVTETDHNSQRSVLIKNDKIEPLFREKIHFKSQELAPTYYLNGGCTIIKTEAFLKEKSFWIPPIGATKIPRNRSVDIDTEEDYIYARFLYEYNNEQ